MNCSVAAREANRLGRPNTDCTEECAESRPVRTAACRVRICTRNSFGEFTEGQQFRLARVTFDGRLSLEEHSPLGEIRIATQLAKFAHAADTMPLVARIVKRPPAYQAGDHDAFTQ